MQVYQEISVPQSSGSGGVVYNTVIGGLGTTFPDLVSWVSAGYMKSVYNKTNALLESDFQDYTVIDNDIYMNVLTPYFLGGYFGLSNTEITHYYDRAGMCVAFLEQIFRGCPALTKIWFPKVSSFGGNCVETTALTELIFPNLEEVAGFRFSYNSSITAYYLPKLRKVGNNFFYNTGSTFLNGSVNYSTFPHLEEIAHSFIAGSNCTGIDLPKVHTLYTSALRLCTTITSIKLTGLKLLSGTHIFYNNTALTELIIPNCLEATDNDALFYGLTNLTKLDMRSLHTLGSDTVDGSCLTNINASCVIEANIRLQTCNAGGEHPSLAYARTRGCTINYH